MQGIIVTPSGDVWSVGLEKNQLVYFPKADLTKAKLLCEGDSAEPCKSFRSPFHLGIDQQDRIWVTNAASDHVVRFPASDPSKVEKFKVGYSPSGLGIDSQGNVWVTDRFGSGVSGLAKLVELGLVQKTGGNFDEKLARTMFAQKGGPDGGSVTLLRPDGIEYPGSPFIGGGLPGPWAATIDGKRQRLDLQLRRRAKPDRAVVRRPHRELPSRPEALSTRCGGQGVTIFYGMAKSVRGPQIGPARAP
jgi:hypothetical protein